MNRIVRLTLLLVAGTAGLLRAHPSSPNQAITAPTVAQLFVAEGEVRLLLEIGKADLPVFADLTADGARETPSTAQLRFFSRGWVIEADEETLRGRVTVVEARRRLKRDAVTGEPLPPGGPPGDPVTVVEVRYPLARKPANIFLKPPKAADGATAIIGLVVWHAGIPVTDFDFFKLPVGFRLDWDDPWKSRFRGLRFQRYYNSPIWATLSVEPRDVRVEIVCRPTLGLHWLEPARDARPPAGSTLPGLGGRVSEYLLSKLTLVVEGKTVRPKAEDVRFLQQKLSKIEGVASPVGIPPETAYLQFGFSFPVPVRPHEVSMRLDIFDPAVRESSLWVNAGVNPQKLTPENPGFEWRDQSTDDDALLPEMPPPEPRYRLPVASLAVGVIGFLWIVPGFAPFRSRVARLVSFAGVVALAAGLWTVAPVGILHEAKAPPAPDAEQSARMVHRILADAYRAFDCREEEAVYDTLAESVSGSLLREAYLSIRRMLDAPSQAGRARVKEVIVQSASLTPLEHEGGYSARCAWVMEVAISHWGHTHTRVTQYDGEMTIRPRDGRWKIDRLIVLDERQADPAVMSVPAKGMTGKKP